MKNIINEGYLAGGLCAYCAFQKLGTQESAFPAAVISFMAGRLVFKKMYCQGRWDFSLDCLSTCLKVAAHGIIAYLTVTNTSAIGAKNTLQSALWITALGCASLGVTEWEESLKKRDASRKISSMILASGFALVAAYGLKQLG